MRVRVPAGRSASPTTDSFQNVAARLGIGQGVNNLASGATYALNPITRQRSQLEWMYRGSWIIGQAVDCVAEDMTRAGIDISSSIEPDKIDVIQKEIDRLGVWPALTDTIKWSRLYGGAIGVLLVDGQDVETPLRPETVGKGQFRGVLCLDRWVVVPAINDTVQELGPHLGKPAFYDVMVSAPAFAGKRIHYSRVIRMEGLDLPYWQKVAEYGWGLSIVERIYDRLVAFDSTTQGTAQLVYKAHLRTVKVEKLRDILAMGGPAEEALIKMFDMIRKFQSSEGLTLIDGADEFDTHSYTFAGLSDVLLQFAQQISGALQIPLVRLFGQSPAGLNATGESDIRSYYDLIKQQQEARLRWAFEMILGLIYRSKIGGDPPEDLNFEFNSLWQMSELEKAQIAVGVTNAVTQAYDSGLVSKPTAMKELRQSSDVSGVWSNITDEEIDEAEEEPPDPGEIDVPSLPGTSAVHPDDGQEGDRSTGELDQSAESREQLRQTA
jgi:phage-related protein (TIGR01555 family)